MKNRLNYLDYLKVTLIVFVIFHHAANAYSPESSWVYKPSNPAEMMPWIWHVLSVNAAFLMGLFFLISGYFVPISYDRQGFKTFVWKKFVRLGIPLIVMATLLSVLSGKLEIGHLWFLESLLLFCLLYALGRLLLEVTNRKLSVGSVQGGKAPTLVAWLIVALVMGVGGYLIRKVSPQDNWIWILGIVHIEPAHYLQYVMMFALGVWACRCQWLTKMKNTTGAMALLIAIVLIIGNFLRGDGPWNNFVYHWFGIYESLLCVFISFGLLWLFREYANGESKFLKWYSRQAYGAYIFHPFFLLVVQQATDPIVLPGIVKLLLIGLATTILSFLFTRLVRLIPGVKKTL
ncbi:MAG: acyltransferase family protein [Prevotella sp.]|nr:acyltransferase family protein [Prevotella sp.]